MVFDRWRRSLTAQTLPKPVVSVGNLTVGGTGKTPLLIRLVNELKNQGRHPAILSRGYGDDEIELMKEKCPGVPVLAGADRAASARQFLSSNETGVFLLDDGFQHWPLQRNLDIVCIDVSAPFEKERLLPAGNMREPWSALARARVAVLTRVHLVSEERLREVKEFVQRRMPGGIVIAAQFNRRLVRAGSNAPLPGDFVRGQNVVALSAIGNPAAFESDLADEGAIVAPLRFRDHHKYNEADLARAVSMASRKGGFIATTEKDWVKLKQWSPDMLILHLDVSFSREDTAILAQEIDKVFA